MGVVASGAPVTLTTSEVAVVEASDVVEEVEALVVEVEDSVAVEDSELSKEERSGRPSVAELADEVADLVCEVADDVGEEVVEAAADEDDAVEEDEGGAAAAPPTGTSGKPLTAGARFFISLFKLAWLRGCVCCAFEEAATARTTVAEIRNVRARRPGRLVNIGRSGGDVQFRQTEAQL